METPRARAGETLVLVFLVALLSYGWLTSHFNWVCDDAYISFRYSKNLADGHGLRYNVGEEPPVEGYSNLLWVLALAPFEAAGWPSPTAARVLSVACGIVLLWRLARFLHRRLAPATVPLLGALAFFATLPPVALWSTSGLETMAFALLVFLAFESLVGHPVRVLPATLSCIGLVLIRAEGFAWALIMIALAGLDARIRDDRSATRPLLAAGGGTAAAIAGLIGFRLFYFGYPLPNTAYAKVGLSALSLERGAKYVTSFVATFPHLALVLAAGVVTVVAGRRLRGSLYLPILLAGGFFAYAGLAGGDWMPMGRFLVPAMPFLAMILAGLLQKLANRRLIASGLAGVAITCSLLPAFDHHLVPHDVRRQLDFRWNSFEKFVSEKRYWKKMRQRVVFGNTLGSALAEHTRPGESLIYGRIGVVGYLTDLFILDQNGLVNTEVAHREAPPSRRSAAHDKTVGRKFFLKDRPTYYHATFVDSPPEDALEFLMKGASAQTRADYAPRIVPFRSRAGKRLFLLLAERTAPQGPSPSVRILGPAPASQGRMRYPPPPLDSSLRPSLNRDAQLIFSWDHHLETANRWQSPPAGASSQPMWR